MTEMLKSNQLSAERLFLFSYQKKGNICYADRSSDEFINLNKSQLKLKKKIIQEWYGFSKDSFEELCCGDAEGFKVVEIKSHKN